MRGFRLTFLWFISAWLGVSLTVGFLADEAWVLAVVAVLAAAWPLLYLRMPAWAVPPRERRLWLVLLAGGIGLLLGVWGEAVAWIFYARAITHPPLLGAGETGPFLRVALFESLYALGAGLPSAALGWFTARLLAADQPPLA